MIVPAPRRDLPGTAVKAAARFALALLLSAARVSGAGKSETFEANVVAAHADRIIVASGSARSRGRVLLTVHARLVDRAGREISFDAFTPGALVRVTLTEMQVWELASKVRLPNDVKTSRTTVGALGKVPPNLVGQDANAPVVGWTDKCPTEIRLLRAGEAGGGQGAAAKATPADQAVPAGNVNPAAKPVVPVLYRIRGATIQPNPATGLWAVSVSWEAVPGAAWPSHKVYFSPIAAAVVFAQGELEPTEIDVTRAGYFTGQDGNVSSCSRSALDTSGKYRGAIFFALPNEFLGKSPDVVRIPRSGTVEFAILSHPARAVFDGKGRLAVYMGYVLRAGGVDPVIASSPVILPIEFTRDGKAPPGSRKATAGD